MQKGENNPRLKRTIGGQEVTLADLHICRLVDWVLDTLNPMLCRVVRPFCNVSGFNLAMCSKIQPY